MGRRTRASLSSFLLLLLASVSVLGERGQASRESCVSCHTDKAALKGSLEPFLSRPSEEAEES